MDGLSRMLPSKIPIPVTFPDGTKKTYYFGSFKLKHYAMVEERIISGEVSAVKAAESLILTLLKNGFKEEAKNLMNESVEKDRKNKVLGRPPVEVVQEWINSIDGIVFTCLLCFQEYHPEMTMGDMAEIINIIGHEKLKELREMSGGTDFLGNEIGPECPEMTVQQNPGTGEKSSGT